MTLRRSFSTPPEKRWQSMVTENSGSRSYDGITGNGNAACHQMGPQIRIHQPDVWLINIAIEAAMLD